MGCLKVPDAYDREYVSGCAPSVLTDSHWESVAAALGLPEGTQHSYLAQAFSHTSFAREFGAGPAASNQRLEFLGDAVLDVVLAQHLYLCFPSLPEGRLTKMKAAIVRAETLSRVAATLSLGDYMLLGRGEEDTGGRGKPSLLADCLEALVGAVYLCAGLEGAREFVLRVFAGPLDEVIADQRDFDHKTALQELLQEVAKQTPTYNTVETTGPPHERLFRVEVRFNDVAIGCGEGASKQLAQQVAAGDALARRDEWLPQATGAGQNSGRKAE
jgi:ribonuclease III